MDHLLSKEKRVPALTARDPCPEATRDEISVGRLAANVAANANHSYPPKAPNVVTGV